MAKFNLPEDLYQYQKEDTEAMASGVRLNFNEMGVGKTPETLYLVEKMGYKLPLIIVPNSLRLEWARQIGDWVGPNLAAVSHPDSYKRLDSIFYSFYNGQKYRIINYETLRNQTCREILSQIPWDVIVFDEIHKLRNPQTKLLKSIWEFLNNFPNTPIYGLSGSPIVNYPNDLYISLSICYPNRYPRLLQAWRAFMYKYCYWSDGRYGAYIYGTRSLETLKEEIKGLYIRRAKKDVLSFLPDKYYRRTLLQMQPDQRLLYDKMENELMVLLDSGEPLYAPCVLAALTRLRQINLDPKILGVNSSSSKTDFLIDFIESTDEKIVIFSCFEKYIFLLSLLMEKTPHVVITGQTAPDKRIEQVRKFQEDDSVKLCLGTIHTMGEGITLTASSNVVLMDRWWNEPINQQAIDRLHRIGQKNAVQVIIPINENSIEERLDEILSKKFESSQEALGENLIRQLVIDDRRAKTPK